MSSQPQLLTVLFADVCGSSSLYKALGNEAAVHKINALLARLIARVDAHHGRLIKTIGDEIMAAFTSADEALDCAQRMHRDQLNHSLQLRIGASYGPVVTRDKDLFGDTVNDAAAVARIARAQEIIITDPLVQALSAPVARLCREFDRVALKGGEEKVLIYRCQWQGETSANATQVMNLVQTQQIHSHGLLLHTGLAPVTLSPDETPFTLGRAAQNHACIDSRFASREHCHILYRRGKYVLVDHSTNGTYVQPEGQREIYLRREELPLEGKGQLSLGQPVAANDNPVQYHNTN